MMDDEDLWSDEINAFVDAAFDSGIVSRNPSDAEEHVAYRYAIKLAIDESRKHGYDHGYYDGCTRSVMQSEDCPKCDKFGDDCGEHSPSWEELAAYWKAEAERLRSIQEQSK